MYIKYLDIMNSKSDDIILQMYKNIILMFGNRITISSLERMDICNIYACNIQIQLYIQETINNKFIEIGEINSGEVIEKEESIFDEYDEENGYIEKEDTKSIYEMYKQSLNCTIKYSINSLKNSYKECMECNLSEMLDYIIFNLRYDEEHKDDTIDNGVEDW